MARAWENDPSNPDASPLIDGWGWDSDYWSAGEWLTWHDAMKRAYGLTAANRRFLDLWNSQSLGANPLAARSFDGTFRNYARDNGFLAGLYGNAPIAAPLGTATDVLTGVGDAGDGIRKAGAALSYVLPVVIVGAVVYLAYSWMRRVA